MARSLESTDDLSTTVQTLTSHKDIIASMGSHGMIMKRLSWEDTARTIGTCYGPNISDMTIVTFKNGKKSWMPIVSCGSNFVDETNDVPIDQFSVPVDNFLEDKIGANIPLKEFLSRLPEFTGNEKMENMLLDRDERIMVKTQACFLPCDEGESVDFGVQMYNYQSLDYSPAVMTIMVSKEGTSVQVLGAQNEILYFNQMGSSHLLKAQRLADIRTLKTGVEHSAVKSSKDMSDEEKSENVLMIFQIPLKMAIRRKVRKLGAGLLGCSRSEASAGTGLVSDCTADPDDGTDMAVLSLGKRMGAYRGTTGNFKIERDGRFPIRCTYQYYRCCKTDKLLPSVIDDISYQLKKVDEVSTSMGSHVLTTDVNRITRPDISTI